ncbi:sensor histidine kinase [Acidipila rosea]|uniref:histidine kinase n=1 Tax=Acidipila rosea TaxID=768535 RepID=A0A4R1LD55_9BACT|nr:ATP-binding protein [Acidipila rosea]TCK75430.1 phospho-acceptor domain-containing protein [Acidipila rosea]
MWLTGPRTIRGQLIAALVVFEMLVLGGFAWLLIREQNAELELRISRRLEFQASQLAIEAAAAIRGGNVAPIQELVSGMTRFPSIKAVQITDPTGRTMFSSDPAMDGKITLSQKERVYLRYLYQPVIFSPGKSHEVVAPIRVGDKVVGLAWIYPHESEDRLQLRSLMRLSLVSGVMVVLGCTLLASLLARSITKPLGVLMRATRQIVRDPEDMRGFPLEVHGRNEAADLTLAFNRMVASLDEQRAGLNDTLAILDSMLANAPIGLVFLDRKYRFVRVNQFLAEISQKGMTHYLGRTLDEAMPSSAAQQLRPALEEVFRTGNAMRDIEVQGSLLASSARPLTWLVSVYPVRSGPAQEVRWVGVIIVDATERKRSEEALRKTEKLAAAGRLAASIAHEINNPLEAVTNLLFLLRNQSSLDDEAISYAEMAQHEVARVSEITQQTLRFYRQSTVATRASITELMDSVLTLHQGRVGSLQVVVERRYRDDAELFCFSGEMRQLFANLIGNGLDAMMPAGGKLRISVRRSRSWREPCTPGIRLSVTDSGCGMKKATIERIFEPFFTTKEATGTGLGLWVSAEIIRKHGGRVAIRSREGSSPGCGTIFMLFFPELPAVTPEMEAQPVGDSVNA